MFYFIVFFGFVGFPKADYVLKFWTDSRDRERETGRLEERQTDRQTDTQTDRRTGRDRQVGRLRDRQADASAHC